MDNIYSRWNGLWRQIVPIQLWFPTTGKYKAIENIFNNKAESRISRFSVGYQFCNERYSVVPEAFKLQLFLPFYKTFISPPLGWVFKYNIAS